MPATVLRTDPNEAMAALALKTTLKTRRPCADQIAPTAPTVLMPVGR
jgi:hypothetical protein